MPNRLVVIPLHIGMAAARLKEIEYARPDGAGFEVKMENHRMVRCNLYPVNPTDAGL